MTPTVHTTQDNRLAYGVILVLVLANLGFLFGGSSPAIPIIRGTFVQPRQNQQLKKSGKETKEEVAELEADGVSLVQIMKEYYTSATDCPESGTPILDISHNTDNNHGDVCRDKMPDSEKWTCPKGCTASSPITKPPYCEMPLGFGGGPCRIKARVDLVQVPSLELELWYGLVIPDSDGSRAAEIQMARQLFNEDNAPQPYRAATMQKAVTPAEPPAPTAMVISVVIAYCKSPLGWLPAYLRGLPSINDLTIYSKCSHEDRLLQSAYMEELHNCSDGRAVIKTLPNVGGCDHTYAYDMANRDWARFAKAEHIVVYLKDNDHDLCTANLDFLHWRVLKPSALVQVAAVSGLGCPIRTEYRDSLWHAMPSFRKWSKTSIHERIGGTEVSTAGAKAPFHSDFSNIGDFADKMGIGLPGRFVHVCYKGNFAVSGGQFSSTPGKVKVARRLERALSRGNSIEEGHFMERLWSAFLHVPLTMAQAESIDRTNKLLRGDFDTKGLSRSRNNMRSLFPGILADLQPQHKNGCK